MLLFLTHQCIYVDRSFHVRSLAVFPIIRMSNHRYTSTGPTQRPARSILKPARSSHTTSAIPSSRPRSALPVVEVRDPSVPTQAAQRAIQSLQDVPLNGPIPAIYFPPTQNRQQLVELLNQFVIQLEADKEGGEEHERTKVPRLQAGRPTYESDEFPEFRQLLMGPWVAGPCCKRHALRVKVNF